MIVITESLSGQTQLSDDLVDPEDNPQKFISLLLESLFVLRKIPETAEVSTVHCFIFLHFINIQLIVLNLDWLRAYHILLNTWEYHPT